MMIKKDIFGKKERGAVAIILTLLIMGVTLLIAFGLSAIFVNEIKSSSLVSRSASAFYAADAGAEYALFQVFKKGESPSSFSASLYNNASFIVSWAANSVDSLGTYSQTKRRVQLTWGP